jgi:uncharacterized membrane protein YeaQ/YmgE (transglycosylase-associated protein family)
LFLILALVVIPLVAGTVANYVVGKGKGFEPWELFVAGIIGSFVGGVIFNLVSGNGLLVSANGLQIHPTGLVGSTIGAIVVLAVWGWFRMRARKSNAG